MSIKRYSAAELQEMANDGRVTNEGILVCLAEIRSLKDAGIEANAELDIQIAHKNEYWRKLEMAERDLAIAKAELKAAKGVE